jgi:hypothetical protein
MVRNFAVALLLLQVCWLTGCWKSAKPPETVPTFPVSGTVHIDGKPASGVKVMIFPANKLPEGYDPNRGSPHSAFTDLEGKFKITTYFKDDGAPVGEYVMVFYWTGNNIGATLADPDEPTLDPASTSFNRKYGDPWKPKVPNVKVEDGKPTDLGTLELTSK